MSKLGIIFLYVALVGALAAIGAGVYLHMKYSDSKALVITTQSSLDRSQKETATAKQVADVATKDRDATKVELTEANTKVSDLNTKLTDAQAQQATLTAAVASSKDAQAKAEADLAHLKDALNNQSPEDIKANADKLTAQIAADASEHKILEDQLQASAKQVLDLTDAVNRRATSTQPPGITGKVTFVNRAWNFVVLNVGLSNGVVPSGELIVYRGRTFLGKVKITSAEATSSVGDIEQDTKDIQIGDDVLN